MPDPAPLRLHDEDPALFREAVRLTTAQTGFVQRLIEKDYFCTVVLEYLAASTAELVFKGGTCRAPSQDGVHGRVRGDAVGARQPGDG